VRALSFVLFVVVFLERSQGPVKLLAEKYNKRDKSVSADYLKGLRKRKKQQNCTKSD